MGVTWDVARELWSAEIWSENKKHHLGRFANFDAAVAARKTAERQLGFHPNHGR